MQQEVAKQGFLDVNNANGRFGRGAGIRESREFFDGAQTPKPVQPALEMWIPLLFWFNKDPRLAIPSVSIPYGQRFLTFNLANANQILQHLHAYDPASDSPATNPVPTPEVEIMELYINNIFVNPEIHDIFIKRIGFSLIRVHRLQTIRVSKANDSLLLNQLKWPIETIYFGFRPTENIDVADTLLLIAWDRYNEVTLTNVDLCCLQNGYSFDNALLPANNITADDYTAAFVSFTGIGLDFAAYLATLDATIVGGTVLSVDQINAALTGNGFPPLIGTFVNEATPTEAEINAALPGTQCRARYITETPIITQISIEAHGVPLYRDIPALFFNQYVPYTYGGTHINTPGDVGAYMITFNLYPGSYQASGHVNISRAREFYLLYTSTVIGSSIPEADLVVIAIAINFLLISDGSAVLRYST